VTSVITASVPQLPARPRETVIAGDVLHHPAAGLEQLGAAVDASYAEQVVARGAVLDAAGARHVGGEHRRRWSARPGDRRWQGQIDRLEGQHLPARGELRLDCDSGVPARADMTSSLGS
jgi:hypothetical protein